MSGVTNVGWATQFWKIRSKMAQGPDEFHANSQVLNGVSEV